MLVSSNSMNVAIVRVNPIHHGFTARPLGVIAWLIGSSYKCFSCRPGRLGTLLLNGRSPRCAKYRRRQRRGAVALFDGTIMHVDLGFDRFSSPEPFKIGGRLVENDLHRYPLNDLHKISGRVLRGQQSESASGTNLQAFDVAFEVTARDCIGPDGYGLTYFHFFQLRLFEVGDDPYIRWNQRKESLSWLHIVARLDAFLRHSPRKRGKDLGVGQL